MTEPMYDYVPAQALDAPDTGDDAYIAKAMEVVARAKWMTELAKETGLARE